jgi:hypothetical protein
LGLLLAEKSPAALKAETVRGWAITTRLSNVVKVERSIDFVEVVMTELPFLPAYAGIWLVCVSALWLALFSLEQRRNFEN